MTAYRMIGVDGNEIFYREAGDPSAPTLLLLHGFPSSSAQYDQLMRRLADSCHVVALDYPAWQEYLRTNRPPALLTWGRNDGFFPPEGARAYLSDLPDAELHLLDTGHFATATHSAEIADLISAFLHAHAAAPTAS